MSGEELRLPGLDPENPDVEGILSMGAQLKKDVVSSLPPHVLDQIDGLTDEERKDAMHAYAQANTFNQIGRMKEATRGDEPTESHVDSVSKYWVSREEVEPIKTADAQDKLLVQNMFERYLNAPSERGGTNDRKDEKILQRSLKALLFGYQDQPGAIDDPQRLIGFIDTADKIPQGEHSEQRVSKLRDDLLKAVIELAAAERLTPEQYANMYTAVARTGHIDFSETVWEMISASIWNHVDTEDSARAYISATNALLNLVDDEDSFKVAAVHLYLGERRLEADKMLEKLSAFFHVRLDSSIYCQSELASSIVDIAAYKLGLNRTTRSTRERLGTYAASDRIFNREQQRAEAALTKEELQARLDILAGVKVPIDENAPFYGIVGVPDTASEATKAFFTIRNNHLASEMNRVALKAIDIDSLAKDHAISRIEQVFEEAGVDHEHGSKGPVMSLALRSGIVTHVFFNDAETAGLRSQDARNEVLEWFSRAGEDREAIESLAVLEEMRELAYLDEAARNLAAEPVVLLRDDSGRPQAVMVNRVSSRFEDTIRRGSALDSTLKLPLFSDPSWSTEELLDFAEEQRHKLNAEIRRWPNKRGVEVPVEHPAFALSGIAAIVAREAGNERFMRVDYRYKSGGFDTIYLDPELHVRTTIPEPSVRTIEGLGFWARAHLTEYFTHDPEISDPAEPAARRMKPALISKPAQLVRIANRQDGSPGQPSQERAEAYFKKTGKNLFEVSEQERSTDPVGLRRSITYRSAVEYAVGRSADPITLDPNPGIYWTID